METILLNALEILCRWYRKARGTDTCGTKQPPIGFSTRPLPAERCRARAGTVLLFWGLIDPIKERAVAGGLVP